MNIDHITYQVPLDLLHSDEMSEFFVDLGMFEVTPDAKVEKDWPVRWFGVYGNGQVGTTLHLVGSADELPVDLRLGHFCLIAGRQRYKELRGSRWRQEIGSGEHRIWLEGPGKIRVEVRP